MFVKSGGASALHIAVRKMRLVPFGTGHGKKGQHAYWNGFRVPNFARFDTVAAMKDQWNETLRCPLCDKTGRASLSQDNGDTPTIQLVPDGFKVVSTRHGPDFYCGVCDVAVKP
jgi:hypothetical protein